MASKRDSSAAKEQEKKAKVDITTEANSVGKINTFCKINHWKCVSVQETVFNLQSKWKKSI